METDHNSAPSLAAVESAAKLYNAIQTAFPQAVANFESKWEAAAATHAERYSRTISAKDEAYTQTGESDALKRLGPKIIPFVVYKLAKGDSDQDLLGVFLYNALESQPDYRPSLEDDLRTCSNRIVELNYQRNKIVEERIARWKELHDRHTCRQSSSHFFTFSDGYEDLLEMGPSIIAPVMVAYNQDPEGYWWDLLHEIIHGRKKGAIQYQKHVFFEKWCDYFNEGDHNEAFEYILTPLDSYVKYGERV
ncbi:hypothetical protein JX265_000480 [Neoarthrinium moseri]|uniref:Uncharacterized protein n=1 Tax=Neoarthrinium moseri TaxID=1658444 RepID=A0A9P9WYU7_9PEZI|nr:hypothetical protein JX266_003362 [Neoarthrinium moseri]KAI1881654.1 hypothetical protein JX265_000480 [Neoarthrinium moseri]